MQFLYRYVIFIWISSCNFAKRSTPAPKDLAIRLTRDISFWLLYKLFKKAISIKGLEACFQALQMS